MSSPTNDSISQNSETGLSAATSPSLESTASVSSVTVGRLTDETNLLITSYGNSLFDTVCVLIWCTRHKKLALKRLSDTKGLWLPSAPIRTALGWYECAQILIKETLRTSEGKSKHAYPSYSPPKLVSVLRIQIPKYCEFITRVMFYTELTYDTKYARICCADTQQLQWYSPESLIGGHVNDLWGPEPSLFAQIIRNNTWDKCGYVEILIKDILLFCPRERPQYIQEEMVKSAAFTESDIFEAFGDYIQHTYPSQYMSLHSFTEYMTRFHFPDLLEGLTLDLKSMFRAFAFNSFDYISFNEFLLGLCAMDKNVAHQQTRVTYISRYYSNNYSTGVFSNYDDIKRLVRDLMRVRSDGAVNESLVDNEVQQILSVANSQQSKRIENNVLIRLIRDGKIRNTSQLFRSETSPVQYVRNKRVYDSLELTQIQFMSAVEAKLHKIQGTCQRCKQKKYTLAVHTVRLSRDGYIVDPQVNRGQSDLQKIPALKRRMSSLCFTNTTVANIMLDTIRSYAFVTGLSATTPTSDRESRATANNWTNTSLRHKMADKILSLLTECQTIFKKEPRVLKVCSPVFVLGDIHGNLHDVMIYEKALWKMGPTCVAADFLFLGDYVDRGEYSIECILYLLSLKSLCPQNYWLLRGNHELRSVQTQFTFKNECLNKFGNTIGNNLWEAFNRVFDYMPVCALIDDSIFCAHGGIPTSTLRIEQLYKMPVPMDDPENQFPSAWQMLWNDPVTNQEFTDYEEHLKQMGSTNLARVAGFLTNTKRGTAYYFSDEALNKFLTVNHLSHVIRAHEVIPNGYAFHMGGKCITIFSSSRYCGGLNEAAVILVKDEKIRVVKIDTNQ